MNKQPPSLLYRYQNRRVVSWPSSRVYEIGMARKKERHYSCQTGHLLTGLGRNVFVAYLRVAVAKIKQAIELYPLGRIYLP